MRALFSFLGVVLLTFQYQLWLGEDSLRSLDALELELAAQHSSNDDLQARNKTLEIEVLDLKNGLEAVEERARSELGLIEEGETFYMILPAKED